MERGGGADFEEGFSSVREGELERGGGAFALEARGEDLAEPGGVERLSEEMAGARGQGGLADCGGEGVGRGPGEIAVRIEGDVFIAGIVGRAGGEAGRGLCGEVFFEADAGDGGDGFAGEAGEGRDFCIFEEPRQSRGVAEGGGGFEGGPRLGGVSGEVAKPFERVRGRGAAGGDEAGAFGEWGFFEDVFPENGQGVGVIEERGGIGGPEAAGEGGIGEGGVDVAGEIEAAELAGGAQGAGADARVGVEDEVCQGIAGVEAAGGVAGEAEGAVIGRGIGAGEVGEEGGGVIGGEPRDCGNGGGVEKRGEGGGVLRFGFEDEEGEEVAGVVGAERGEGGRAGDAEGVEVGVDAVVEIGEGREGDVGGAGEEGALGDEEGELVEVLGEEIGVHWGRGECRRVFHGMEAGFLRGTP